ncbi:hypothetical protein [Floccifex sp.]|uniref:hypothetical protein n=1 Tax=Floccifex sp. TaxID=2815810 RepID=UPI003F1108B8
MSEKFNQTKYINEWAKQNMATVIGKYKKEFVAEFKEACKILGIKQSEVIRNAMIETINKAKEKGEI